VIDNSIGIIQYVYIMIIHVDNTDIG